MEKAIGTFSDTLSRASSLGMGGIGEARRSMAMTSSSSILWPELLARRGEWTLPSRETVNATVTCPWMFRDLADGGYFLCFCSRRTTWLM